MGTFKVREYQDKEHQTRQSLEVAARSIGFAHVEPSSPQQASAGQAAPAPASAPAQQGAQNSSPESDPWGIDPEF